MHFIKILLSLSCLMLMESNTGWLATAQAVKKTVNAPIKKKSCEKVQKSPQYAARSSKGAIFEMLSTTDIAAVTQWMISSSGLNITAFDDADINQNYVSRVFAAPPQKAIAIAYLDGVGPAPVKEAFVHVSMGALPTPYVREYRVGPLPVSASTYATPVTYQGVQDIPFNARPLDSKDYVHVEELVVAACKEIEAEMIDSFGASYDSGDLVWVDTAPRGPLRHESLFFTFNVDANYANPIGLTMAFDIGGVDSTTYKLLLLTYNGVAFTSTASFKAAYADPNWLAANKIPNAPLKQFLINSVDGIEWASLKKSPNPSGVRTRRGQFVTKTRLNSDIPAPQITEPAGRRYLVAKNYVEYLGWSFYFSHHAITGPILYDLRYRGEKIAYEIGVSEAAAIYSGVNDLIQASTVYMDSAWGLGTCAAEQVLGVDCPSTGTLLDVTFLEDSGTPTTLKNVLCLFETDEQVPLRKHWFTDYEVGYATYGGLARTALVMRVTLPVYNYDYILDYVLYPNGAIEVRAVTSGYLQAAYTSPALSAEEQDYSPRVHHYTAGTTHDHFFSIKLDLDIAGSNNKLLKTEITSVAATPQSLNGINYRDHLSSFAVADDYETKKLVKSVVGTEDGFTIIPSTPTQFSVAANENNQWGHPRSYVLKFNGITQNLVANTKSNRALSFTKHSLIATRHHDNEPSITSFYDQGDTTGTIMASGQPLVDSNQLVNAENIDNQDLVLWATIGLHHIPHSEDIPVTHTIGNGRSISLVPANMFDYDDSMDLGNSVFADHSCDGPKAPASCTYTYDLKTDSSNLCPLTYKPLGSNL